MEARLAALEDRLADLETAVLSIMDLLASTTEEDGPSHLQDNHLAFVERIHSRRLKEQR
jgi:hypothetical protein